MEIYDGRGTAVEPDHSQPQREVLAEKLGVTVEERRLRDEFPTAVLKFPVE
jgi:hypothetical protein